MSNRKVTLQLIRLAAVSALLPLVGACAPAKEPEATAIVPSQTPAPAPTATPVPATETPVPQDTPTSEAAGQPMPELSFGADRWRLTAATFQSEVTVTTGPQQQTLTAESGKGFVVLELESVTGTDLFGLFVQNGAELSSVYLTDGQGNHHPALQFTSRGIPAERFTIVFEAISMTSGAAIDFHFLDADPVPLVGLLQPAAVAQTPTGEPYYLYPFCNCEDEVPPDMAPILRWAWGTTTQEYLDEFLAASTSTLFIDGERYTDLEAYWGEGSYSTEDGAFKSYWIYPLPSLPAGVHKVELRLSLDRGVTDGFDGNADGKPDQYGPGEAFYGWVDVRVAAPYGPPSAECPNGAPAGHWALIVNKASAGQGTITIDGEPVTVQSGRNVIYLTADVNHPILLGTSTIGYSAQECGENSLDIP